MALTDIASTDYYRVKWNVVEEKEATLKEKLVFGGVVSGVMFGSIWGLWLWNSRLELVTLEFFYMSSFFAVMIVMVLGRMWSRLLLGKRYRIWRYRVNREGVFVGKRRYGYARLKREGTLERLERLEGEEIKGKITVMLPARKQKVRLLIENEKTRDMLIRALRKYLSKEG